MTTAHQHRHSYDRPDRALGDGACFWFQAVPKNTRINTVCKAPPCTVAFNSLASLHFFDGFSRDISKRELYLNLEANNSNLYDVAGFCGKEMNLRKPLYKLLGMPAQRLLTLEFEKCLLLPPI